MASAKILSTLPQKHMASALEMWITGEVSSQRIVVSKIFWIKNDNPGSSFFTFFLQLVKFLLLYRCPLLILLFRGFVWRTEHGQYSNIEICMNNKDTRIKRIATIRTPEQLHRRRSDVFIVDNFEHSLHFSLIFLF